MPIELEFGETDPAVSRPASPAELRTLKRLRRVLRIEEGPGGTVTIGPRAGYVGSLELPGGGFVRVRPKVEIGAPTALLALAYRTMAHPQSVGSSSYREADPSDWLRLQLVAELERLLARGLRRGYVDERSLLPFVRGRMRPLVNPARLPLLDCEYADFTLDTPLNCLLRSALELIANATAAGPIKRRMREALARLSGVSLKPVDLNDFDRVALDALSTYYEPTMNLCRLALEGSGLDRSGRTVAPSFFVAMWRVWEAALANAVRDCGVAVHSQAEFVDKFVHVTGSPSPVVVIRPDLLVGPRRRPKLVIDAKWASATETRYGAKRLVNAHLYQIASYCLALDCDGALVYPRTSASPVDTTYAFAGHQIRVLDIDLGGETLAGLEKGAAALIAT